MTNNVGRCQFANTDENGGHDFTDAYSPDGHPEFLYCRRCGEVILRGPEMVVVPRVPAIPEDDPTVIDEPTTEETA